MSLTFKELREANLARLPLFKGKDRKPAHSEKDGSDWSLNDWVTAVTGELGELANLLKKVKRKDFTLDQAREKIAFEIADVQIYLDILAYRCGVDLGQATADKFNEVSCQQNLPVRLEGGREVLCHYPGCGQRFLSPGPCALCYG